jgi:hypothetical protein
MVMDAFVFRIGPGIGFPPSDDFTGHRRLRRETVEWIARSLAGAEDFRGCAFLNAIAELGRENSEARRLAVSYKESRRIWYRDLLSTIRTRWQRSSPCWWAGPMPRR